MTYSKTLLTRFKALPEVGSTNKAAKILGLSRTALYHVQNEVHSFSDPIVIKMAEMLSLNTVETVLRVHIDTGNCPETRQFWEQVLAEHKRLQEIENKGKKRVKAA